MMRDFPLFTTEYGVASLFLKEIPYKNEAYIRICDVQEDFFREHLNECVSFCRMCGAERIFAADHEKLEQYPLFASILEMRGTAWVDKEKMQNLFPVSPDATSCWCSSLPLHSLLPSPLPSPSPLLPPCPPPPS